MRNLTILLDRGGKLGRLTFSKKFLYSTPLIVLSQIFSKFFPIKIEDNNVDNLISYTGYSEEFDELEVEESIPEYLIYFRKVSNEKIFVENFKRINTKIS